MKQVTTWADVDIDTRIRDAGGTVWRVAALDELAAGLHTSPAFRCVNASNVWVTIEPKPLDDPVEIVPDDAAPLIEMLRDNLGAEVLARKDNESGRVTCEAWPAEPYSKNLTSYRVHLDAVHGIFVGDVRGWAKLAELHEIAHSDEHPNVGKHIAHIHV